jgi:hypothetical protein
MAIYTEYLTLLLYYYYIIIIIMNHVELIKGIFIGIIFSVIDNLIFIYEDIFFEKYNEIKFIKKLNVKEKYLIIGAFAGIISYIISKLIVDKIYKKYEKIKSNIYGDIIGMIIGLIIVLYFYHNYLKSRDHSQQQHLDNTYQSMRK